MSKTIKLGLVMLLIALIAAGCSRQSSVCATDPPNLPVETRQPENFNLSEKQSSFPQEIQIRNKMVAVDQIIHGSICDDVWRGVVYVDCDVAVPDWEKEEDGSAKFFEDCYLVVEDGTVIYVAYHNDEAYYKGCSCHTNE